MPTHTMSEFYNKVIGAWKNVFPTFVTILPSSIEVVDVVVVVVVAVDDVLAAGVPHHYTRNAGYCDADINNPLVGAQGYQMFFHFF